MKRFISMSINPHGKKRVLARVSNHGVRRPSFETPRKRAAPQDEGMDGALMVRSAAQRRVSNHGSSRPSFETPRKRAAPQDEGFETRSDGALLRMRGEPHGEERRTATRLEP
jgi:hypothetical protein